MRSGGSNNPTICRLCQFTLSPTFSHSSGPLAITLCRRDCCLRVPQCLLGRNLILRFTDSKSATWSHNRAWNKPATVAIMSEVPDAPQPTASPEHQAKSAFGAFRHRRFTVVWTATVVANIGQLDVRRRLGLADDEPEHRPIDGSPWSRSPAACRYSCSRFRPGPWPTSSTSAGS